MLRITVDRQAAAIEMTLEGRLAGAWVEELRKVLASSMAGSDADSIAINLTAVSGMDCAGRDLLIESYARGVDLRGSGLSARAFIEEMAEADCSGKKVRNRKYLP